MEVGVAGGPIAYSREWMSDENVLENIFKLNR